MAPLRCTTEPKLRFNLSHRNHPNAPDGRRWKNNSRRLLACVTALIVMLTTIPSSFAQQPAQPAAAELSDVQRLIRSSIRDRAPKTPLQIAQAAEMLVNVELYDEAKTMLGQLQALNLNDAQLSELTSQFGSSFFQDIYLSPQLHPIGRTVGDYVLRGAQKGLQSPERYDSLLRSLNSDDISARSKAVRQLRSIGEPAIATVLNAFTDDDRVDAFPGLRSVLQTLGAELPEPIIAAALADDPQVKLEAIRALDKINSKEALSVLYLTILAREQNNLVRATAFEILTKRTGTPLDFSQVESWFRKETVDSLQNKSDPVLVRQPSNTWIWNKKLQKVVSQPSNVATDRCRRASYFARGLYESNPESSANRQLYLLTQLELAKRVAGPNTAIDSSQQIKKFGLSAMETNQLLCLALKHKLFPAATACCEILKSMGDVSVMTQLSGNYPPLTHAILSGERSVQFAALDAIAQLDPQHAFPGSSHAMTLAVYLASGSGQPAALIGHHRLDLAQTYAASIASSGLRGESAMTGKELFEIATTNSDIEIILISDTITNPSYSSLIQQLRNDWRTSQTPIAFLYSDANQSQRAALQLKRNNVTILPFTLAPELIASSIDQMVNQVSTFRQDRLQRNRQAKVAIQWLAKVAKNRQAYSFYNLGRQQAKIQQLIYQPGFSAPVTEILANIATPEAQQQLLNFASETGLPIEQRQSAVKAFQDAVERSGIMLTTDEILLQYNRYNASHTQPKETQQLLGSILDIIEASKR